MVRTPTTKPSINPKTYPPRKFYMVAVREVLQRGDPAEIADLLKGAQEMQKEFGDIGAVITRLKEAQRSAKG
jgi:hypothetical protein